MATIDRRGKYYRVRIRRRGFPSQTRSFDTRAAAEAWARSLETAQDQGTWTDLSEARRTTVGDACSRYEREVTAGKGGKVQEERRLAMWRDSDFANYLLTQLRGTDLAAWRDERLAAGRAPATVRRDLAVLSALYRHAATEWGMAGLPNPVSNIRLPSPGPGRERRLRPGEEKRLRAAAPTPEWDILITVALETAMRRGELVALRRDQLDLKRRVAHLPKTKNGEARDVPLSTTAVRALKQLPRRLDGRVFSWKPDTVSTGWRKLCRRAGVQDLTFHDLRHEATSRLVESGKFSMLEIAAITGHKTLTMLKRYTQLRAEDLARKLG